MPSEVRDGQSHDGFSAKERGVIRRPCRPIYSFSAFPMVGVEGAEVRLMSLPLMDSHESVVGDRIF